MKNKTTAQHPQPVTHHNRLSNRAGLSATAAAVLLLAACGGGSDGPGVTGEENAQTVRPPVTASTSTPAVKTGILIDSPVIGARFSSSTQTGYTDANGAFRYQAGETITFSIGSITLGTAKGADRIFIDGVTVPGTSQPSRVTSTRIGQLLQTLDADGDPQNGIDLRIGAEERNRLWGLAFNSSSQAAFDQQLQEVLTTAGISATPVSFNQAREHLDSQNPGITVSVTPAPTPAATSTPEPTATATPQPTATPEPTTVPGATATPRPTATATPGSTATPRPTATPEPTTVPGSTATPRPTATAIPRPTATPEPTTTPGSTATPRPTATATPRPTATPEPTTVPGATATPRPTATATPEPTIVPSATVTPRPTTTATPRPGSTATPRPTATATPRPTATATPRPTATATPRPTATATPRPTATATPRPTATPGPTATPTPAPVYAQQPDVANCRPSVLSQAEKDKVLAHFNNIRSLHRLPPVTYDSSSNAMTAQSALISAANGKISHTPATTSSCYTSDGATGSKKSNLYISYSSASGSVATTDALDWLLIDDGVSSLGHRRWMLHPFLKLTAVGRAEGRPNTGTHTGYYVNTVSHRVIFDQEHTDISSYNLEYVAYPYRDYPNSLFKKDWFLSFSAIASSTSRFDNRNVDYTNASIQVTDANGNTMTVSDKSHNTNWYGNPNSLQWKVAGLQDNVRYNVSIQNVKVNGTNKNYSYYFKLK